MYFGMSVRAQGILALRDAPGACDHFGDLGCRQDPPLAGLGALGQFDLEHADAFVGGDLAQLVIVQFSAGIAHAILRRADLEYQVAAALQGVIL